jgi:hypothetical protein
MKHIFYGIYRDREVGENTYGEKEDVDVTYYRLDDTLFKLVEDPDDGYRSYGHLTEYKEGDKIYKKICPLLNLANYPVVVYNDVIKKRDYFDGVILYLDKSCKAETQIAMLGTDNSDDWYPFHMDYVNVEKLNKLIMLGEIDIL